MLNQWIGDYACKLYEATSFDEAFSIFQNYVTKLGFEGVLYTYIPRPLIDSNFRQNPIYVASNTYSPKYLSHYAEARFEKHDPLIKAVSHGVTSPIDWHGNICEQFTRENSKSAEVINTSKDYDITNGLTLPTMNNSKGISGASFISSEKHLYHQLLKENLHALKKGTRMFHSLVVSDATLHCSVFIKPLINKLSTTEQSVLKHLALGKAPKQISYQINKSDKYLEEVIRNLRTKLSNPEEGPSQKINKNQLMYYAGLLGVMDANQ